MITANSVEQVKSQTNIVDIISEFVELKQKGQEFVAPCPFVDHTENTPSFKVSGTKQIYKCFGCGKGGNVFTFLMEYSRMTFPEAVKYCAKRVGIVVEETHRDDTDKYEKLSELNEKATTHFQNTICGDYLSNARGLTQEIIQQFRLGYDNSTFTSDLDHNYLKNESGIFYETPDKRLLTRWWDRCIFPFIDINGKIIGFAGNNKGADPKYLNSPETILYHKSRFLYGLYQAKDEIIRQKGVIIVEGYFDCLMMHQAGIKNVVAICGSALTIQHAKLLSRFCKDVVLMFDSDKAGKKAVNSSMSNLFEVGMNVFVCLLPDNKDPDDVIKELGHDGMHQILETETLDWFTHSLEYFGSIGKMNVIDKATLVADNILTDGRRKLFLNLVAEHLKMDIRSFDVKRNKFVREVQPGENKCTLNEMILLASVHKNILGDINQINREVFATPIGKKLYDIIHSAEGNDSDVYNNLNVEESKVMSYIMDITEQGISYNLDINLRVVMMNNIDRESSRIIEEISEKEVRGEDYIALTNRLNELITEKERIPQ